MIGEYSNTNVLQRRYVPGPGLDEPLVWYEGAGVSDRRWLIADERGSVIAVTGAGGVAASINAYDEYGIPRAGNSGRFGFAGQPWLAEVALTHSRARAYAPNAGRFVQADPILTAGGMNLYAYVGNDPVNFSDPFGLIKCWIGLESDTPELVECGQPPKDDPWRGPPSALDFLAGWLDQNSGIALLNRWEAIAAARVAAMETVGLERPSSAEGHERMNEEFLQQMFLECVADNTDGTGAVGAIIGGAAAYGAGAEIFPKQWAGAFGGRFDGRVGLGGGGPSGRFTSVTSAALRGYFGGSRAPTWLSRLTRTRDAAGGVGRVISTSMRVVGAGTVAFGAGVAGGAAYICHEAIYG